MNDAVVENRISCLSATPLLHPPQISSLYSLSVLLYRILHRPPLFLLLAAGLGFRTALDFVNAWIQGGEQQHSPDSFVEHALQVPLCEGRTL
jgi:hypothetical protein